MKKILKLIVLVTLGLGTLSAQEAEVKAEEKKADEKKLELKARVQTRMVMGQANSGFANTNDFDTVDFNFRRIRFGVKYEPVQWAGGMVEFKAENLAAYKSGGIETLGGIQEANIFFKPGLMGSVIKMGQFKIPFLRDQLTSSGSLINLERAFSEKLIQQFDIGVLLELQPLELVGKDWAKKLDLAVSYTNGNGSLTDGIGVKKGEMVSGSNYLKLFNWRAQINPFGGPVSKGKESSWKHGEEIFHEGNLPVWSIAAAGAHTGDSEYGHFKGSDLDAYTFDTSFYWYGVYLNGEYTLATGGAVPAGDYNTFQATVGYNFKLGSIFLMPVVRYNFVKYDENVSGAIGESERDNQLWIGLNLFALKHDLKFQAFYCLVNDATGSSLDEDVFYFQVTSSFGKKL
jgi:hypothetical protein